MAYNKTVWENLPSTNTPINATNLNKSENELKYLDNNAIVEEGSNSNGSYIKYENGLMICYGTKQLTLDLTTSYEGAYYSDTNDINFPVQFIGNPTITTGVYTNSSLISFNTSTYNNTKFKGFVWKNQAKSNIPVNIYFTAIGRWK